jgi:hypothetical protein
VQPEPIQVLEGFGWIAGVVSQVQISPLAIEAVVSITPKPEPSPVSTRTAAIQRLVSEDAYIDKAIATMDTVMYDGVPIGMRGAPGGEAWS